MKVIKAWWWREHKNLGDVLTPYIVGHLSEMKCKHIGIKWIDAIIYILKHIYAGTPIKWSVLWPVYFREPEYILGVGSILHIGGRKSIAWGSGFLFPNGKFLGKQAVAVRGCFSADILLKQGFPQVDVLGDPALLLPIVYQPLIPKSGRVAIVPHFSEYQKFINLYGDRFDIINLNTDDVEGTIDKIFSCSYVFSTSLHGLIICHAYGIPAIWIEDKVLAEDNYHFKFKDYFSSVGIEYYEPYRNFDEILKGDISYFFEINKKKSSTNTDLHAIQLGLLKVAPFPICSKFII